MSHSIRFVGGAIEELEAVRKFEQRKIVARIESQLIHEPTKGTKNRKRLESVSPGFAYDPPLWELRVGEFRVFYDVDEKEKLVMIRAIRRKKSEDRTEDIIQ